MQVAFENVSYVYGAGSPFQKEALTDVAFTIPTGTYVGVIGHTGSGKSTLIQHINGLMKPTTGVVRVGEWNMTSDSKVSPALRKQVGLVFQYPEHQLFEETVEKDVIFGPLNFGVSRDEAIQHAKDALKLVGLDYEWIKNHSPFQLSGGQMRRVAIAGVLAMQPSVLVLDEPTAGLDPAGRQAILDNIYAIHKERQLTTFLVTHSMEEAARYADVLLVMAGGQVKLIGPPQEIFRQSELLREISLDVPATVSLVQQLNEQLPIEQALPTELYREEDLLSYLVARLHRSGGETS